MARLIVEGSDLVVGLSWLEKLGAFRGDVRVPLSAVHSAEPGTHVASSGTKLLVVEPVLEPLYATRVS